MARLAHMAMGDPQDPPILFLHGFMGSSADWKEVMKSLAHRFYCTAVDLPGHGASLNLPPDDHTVEGTARKVFDALGELGIKRPKIIGYSMGGRLALYLALRYPTHFSGLFLESASPGLESPEERRARREADEMKAQRLESEDFTEFLEDWYRQPLFASVTRNEGLLQQTIEARLHNDPAELAKSLRGLGTGRQLSLWGELSRLQVPALAVAGELDEKFVEIGRRMEAESPMIGFAQIPGVGHNVHDESPGPYIGLLKDFLESI